VILVLDNRDSFTFNLAQALESLGARVCVRAARATTLSALGRLRPAGVLIGPGPGRPEEARLALELIAAWAGHVPILGVCLGHQALALACGARVARAREPVHGHAIPVRHDGQGVFRGLPSPLECMRYNSLSVLEQGLPDQLVVSARAPDGDVMGLRHRELPLEGVQFHPESVLSEGGLELLGNFLERTR
jgi:anthranilate synthase/aminodeoxychorismate synthase-like glutamine amidotransferase